ncbi:helix-turn-helix transcriptional regulator [Planctomicrobium sp. SH661]|uniref:helix-turn-helix transcriptional regulator n=1 Tax=Planctomicrobium sp. SH661 TaxID=3448124 RepID=UPI003F5BA22C
MPPNDFLQRLRIKQAQTDLLETDLSITEIAFNNGFSTSQYFSTVFRKYTGDTPARFRKRREP